MRYLFGFFTAAALGTGLHFLYGLCPLPLAAVVAPIRESVWEHLKLLIWPVLAGALVPRRRDFSYWGSVCLTILLMPPVLLGAYYSALCGLGLGSPALDIGLYYVTLVLGFLLLYHLRSQKWTDRRASIFLMLAAIWACCTFILSMYPPDLPIFRP